MEQVSADRPQQSQARQAGDTGMNPCHCHYRTPKLPRLGPRANQKDTIPEFQCHHLMVFAECLRPGDLHKAYLRLTDYLSYAPALPCRQSSKQSSLVVVPPLPSQLVDPSSMVYFVHLPPKISPPSMDLGGLPLNLLVVYSPSIRSNVTSSSQPLHHGAHLPRTPQKSSASLFLPHVCCYKSSARL